MTEYVNQLENSSDESDYEINRDSSASAEEAEEEDIHVSVQQRRIS